MAKAKIGRNDPCPCGSGKKYKNCCLRSDEATGRGLDLFDRYNQMITSLKVKLDREYGTSIKKIRQSALDYFLKLATSTSLPAEHESIFSDWLWFDYHDEDRPTLIDEYRQSHGEYSDEQNKACLRELSCSYLSIYQLVQTDGNLMEIKDLCSGLTHQVHLKEPYPVKPVLKDSLLLARLINTTQGSFFSGVVLMLKNDPQDRNLLLENLDYCRRLTDISDPTEFLKQHGEVLYGIFDHINHKINLSLKAITLVQLPDLSPDNQKLLPADLLIPLYKAGGWQWYRPCGCTGYARLATRDNMILIAADQVQDIPLTVVLLDRLNNYASRTICNLFNPPAPTDLEFWLAVMKDRLTEKWMNTPHAELKGKTPAEILARTDGPDTLLQLLNSYHPEELPGEKGKELLAFMRERITNM